MSFLDRLFGTEEADESANDVAAIALAQEQALSRIAEMSWRLSRILQ